MVKSSVLSFTPFMVAIDVTIELPLLSATLTLCFGPFNARESAEEWATEVERAHKSIERKETALAGEIHSEEGIPTGVFVRSYVNVPDVILATLDARKEGNLIPTHEPAVDARDMHVYALYALQLASMETLKEIKPNGK